VSGLSVITTTVTGNEKAYAYFEVHQQSPSSKGFQRYRVIFVNRDGKLAEYREDMGKASKFKGVRQLSIPSFWEHSVDELKGIADELRNLDNDKLDIAELLELDKYKLA
jgi:hypothetical protein